MRAVTLALVFAALAAPAIASAQPSTHAAAAEELFRAGRALIAQHQYKAACEKLALSQKLDPAVGTLLSLGECYSGQGRTASAWLAYRAAVAIAASHTDPRSAAAEERANALEPLLSRVVVDLGAEAAVQDVHVAIDDESFPGEAFRAPVPIDPGDHAITVSAQGYASWSTHVTVGSTAATVNVEVPPLRSLPKADELALERSRQATRRTAGLVVGGTGLVAIGVGAILGLQAIVKIRDAHDLCPHGGACADAQGVHDNDLGGGLATASTVVIPVGAALVGVASYLVVTSRSNRGPEIGAEATPNGARVRVGWTW
jgi:hypothetical protein